jgi:hypothetical protein
MSYVAAIEAAGGGPTARPVFIGRVETLEGNWGAPVHILPPGGDVAPGALIFALDGRFVGLATPFGSGLVLVPHAALETLVAGPPGAGR